MSSSSADKTEKATPKRLRDARKKGQLPRSRELSTGLVVGAGMFVLMALGADLAGDALGIMREALTLDPRLLDDPSRAYVQMGKRLFEGFLAVLPILLATLAAALFAPALIGGWNFSAQSFQPDFSRLSLIAGVGRMFSANALVELLKSLLKFVVLGAIGAWFIWGHRGQLMSLSRLDLHAAIGEAAGLAASAAVWMTGGLVLIAFVDAPYQKWQHAKRLRMTKQEVREEYKEAEGKPEVKAKIRQLQQQMSRRRMMEAVPTADVVVTNPTHYAVALRYSAGKSRAPVVVAKGAGAIAAVIRELAQQHKVPLLSAPPLARALYRSVELDQEIPAQLYQAVAQVLSYIYQLRSWRGGSAPPVRPEIGDVPGGEPDPDSETIGPPLG